MALQPSNVADVYKDTVEEQSRRFRDKETLYTESQLGAIFAEAYEDYVKGGTLLGGNLAAGGILPPLKIGMSPSRDSTVVATMANAIAAYWASCVTVGTPSHGGTAVVSVVIPVVPSAIQAALEAQNVPPYPEDAYLSMIQAIQDVVTATPCVITELMPPNATPTPFTEYIS